jgi:acetyltransferase
MTIRNLEYLFEPGSVALVGASADERKLGHVIARNLLAENFHGSVWFVNPNRRHVLGQTVFASIGDLPAAPDLAVIATPPETVPGIVDELGRIGTRAAIVVSARFQVVGADGATLRQQMLDASRPWLLRLLGPSSLGIAVPGLGLNASFGHLEPRQGELAFVAQSGTVVSSVVDWAHAWNIGFSHLVSLGEAADVDFGDLLDYLADRKEAAAILLYIEQVSSPRKFMSAARAAARMKPVVVVKAGRGTSEAPTPATGAATLVHPDAVYGAAFRRAGLLRVDELGELFGAAEILSRFQKVRGESVFIVTNSGGMALMATDELTARRGLLARLSEDSMTALEGVPRIPGSNLNPIDLGGDADSERYARALDAVLGDPGVDATLVLHSPTAVTEGDDLARGLADRRQSDSRPVLLTSFVGETSVGEARRICAEAGIPSFGTPEETIQGFMYLVNYRRNQRSLMETPPSVPRLFVQDVDAARRIIDGVLADGREWLDAEEARSLMRAYGVPMSEHGPSRTEGGPGTGALELLVGATVDSHFGPVIVFGRGGAAAVAIADVAIGLPPVNMRLARDMMERTQVYHQVKRGRYGADADPDPEAVGLVILQVAQLVTDFGEIMEVEINPLLVTEDRVIAAEARVRVSPSDRPPEARLAILPYPKSLEEEFTAADGRTLLLRPIVPEDEPALLETFDDLTQEEIRLRFHSPLKVLTHMMAARFTQLDYDREMALVLTEPGTPGKTPIHGVVRLHTDPDHEHGDFAILVQHAMTGKGLGTHMLERIIDYARQRGLTEIGGDVLNENKVMLALARKLGFTVKPKLHDRGVMRITLPIGRGGDRTP